MALPYCLFCWLWASQKLMIFLLSLINSKIGGHFVDFEKVKIFSKTPLWETGCLGNPYSLLTGCLGIQFFNLPPSSKDSQLRYLWLSTPHCAALVWLTGHHAIPLVIKCFSSNPYLGKQIISLGVTSILSMCLHSHT